MKTVKANLNIAKGLLPAETVPISFSLHEEEADHFELNNGPLRSTIRARFVDPSRDLGPLKFGLEVKVSIEGIAYDLLDVDLDAREFALKVSQRSGSSAMHCAM
jgi:hypothetical protein